MSKERPQRVLVLGSGAREHALAWAIGKEIGNSSVFLHPGNGGTSSFANLGEVDWLDADAIIASVRTNRIDLVVIGPEKPLAEAMADKLRSAGVLCFGPSQSAARLETSKAFAKAFLEKAQIPTGRARIVDNLRGLLESPHQFPVVLKLDGLAAGKGVVIANHKEDVAAFAKRVWTDLEFGQGPHQVLVEDFLEGKELSYIGLCDGNHFLPLSSSSDYKRIGEGDTGPNTGGMGAISPSPVATEQVLQRIESKVITPVLAELKRRGLEYRGALYVGLMISSEGEPYVLEFNTRFGDPETQALMMRVEDGLASALLATARGDLKHTSIRWKQDHAVYVVGAAGGYPGTIRSGDEILGTEKSRPPKTEVFFAGVTRKDGKLYTSGGRVLGIGATGRNLSEARKAVYAAWENIFWTERTIRRDIGA